MEYEQLSDYDKFILLSAKSRGVSANMQAFYAFRNVMEILAECAKSDTSSLRWKDNIVTKPITRQEAEKALTNIKQNKWDNIIFKVCRAFQIELRSG
jgi:hypothetical protein